MGSPYLLLFAVLCPAACSMAAQTAEEKAPGRLAMANSGANTGSCQFFITDTPAPHIDGAHTIFGQVVEGQNVISLIGTVELDADDKPVKPVKLNRVVIERMGPEAEKK